MCKCVSRDRSLHKRHNFCFAFQNTVLFRIIGGTLSKGVLVDESLPLVWINNQHEGYTPLWLLLTSFSYSVPLCMPTLECLPLFLYQSLSGPAVFNEKTRKKVKHRVATGNTAHTSRLMKMDG